VGPFARTLARLARLVAVFAGLPALLAVDQVPGAQAAVPRDMQTHAAAPRDRDGDRLPDRWEKRHDLSIRRKSGNGDPDRDSLRNRVEYRLRLDPRRQDTDRDGLSDGREVRRIKTNPRRRDSDGDGVSDGREVALGTDPLDRSSKPGQPRAKPPTGDSGLRAPGASTILPEDPRGLAGILRNPIDPAQQTLLSFGDRSHWLQPWRAYLETVPATKLRDAIGINFNVAPGEAAATATLLARSGFARARVEIGWGALDYETGRIGHLADVRTILAALRDNGIRPLILLNANHGIPCPARFFDAVITQSAPRGARQVTLDRATAEAVVPGKTGLNSLSSDYKAADVIFTSVDGGVATLAKPLPRDLAPGTYPAATLRYAPFGQPRLSDGSSNPGFEQTLAGWLGYVEEVTGEVRGILGNDNFDVELWNELSFGSDFLWGFPYYDPPTVQGSGDPTQEIAHRTVAWLRDPAHGVSGVGITNGFESERPWASGTTSPPGLSAISKHPYLGMKRFAHNPASAPAPFRPLDALGHTAGVEEGARNHWRDYFVPTYEAFFPEHLLTALQTEHFIRDLSPITTEVYGTPHGRLTRPAGGEPPTIWITEWNMHPAGADPNLPSVAQMTANDVRHMQAKAVLRFATSWVNKGASAVHFYAVKGNGLDLVDPAFFTSLYEGGGAYPGDDRGGEAMMGFRRLAAALAGARQLRQTRSLSLQEIGDYEGHKQFDGDGTAAHPPLYDRDVVGFFPYQLDDHRFVVSTYVMTRSIVKLYRPNAPRDDSTRYDLPEARFRLTIGGLRTGAGVDVRATDPLSGRSVPTRVVSGAGDTLVVELPLTDSPRLLTIAEAG
jgi:hypothetical protein